MKIITKIALLLCLVATTQNSYADTNSNRTDIVQCSVTLASALSTKYFFGVRKYRINKINNFMKQLEVPMPPNRVLRLIKKIRIADGHKSGAEIAGFVGGLTIVGSGMMCLSSISKAEASIIVNDPVSAIASNSDFRQLVSSTDFDIAVNFIQMIADGESESVIDEFIAQTLDELKSTDDDVIDFSNEEDLTVQ
jgi:hypothetical protein